MSNTTDEMPDDAGVQAWQESQQPAAPAVTGEGATPADDLVLVPRNLVEWAARCAAGRDIWSRRRLEFEACLKSPDERAVAMGQALVPPATPEAAGEKDDDDEPEDDEAGMWRESQRRVAIELAKIDASPPARSATPASPPAIAGRVVRVVWDAASTPAGELAEVAGLFHEYAEAMRGPSTNVFRTAQSNLEAYLFPAGEDNGIYDHGANADRVAAALEELSAVKLELAALKHREAGRIRDLETATREIAEYKQIFETMRAELVYRTKRIEALAKFKAYCHQRLDAAGVPVDPDSPHKAEGCRIGGRLDWLMRHWRRDEKSKESLSEENAKLLAAMTSAQRELRKIPEALAAGIVHPTLELGCVDKTLEILDAALSPSGPAAPKRWYERDLAAAREQRDELIKFNERAAAELDAVKRENEQLRGAIKRAGYAVMQTSGDWLICDVSEYAKREEERTAQVISENIQLASDLAAARDALARVPSIPAAPAQPRPEQPS